MFYPEASLMVSVQNRLKHFKLTFPFNVTQVGLKYELIYVNYGSQDNFSKHLVEIINENNLIFSKDLFAIKEVIIKEPIYFNPRKSKNLGVNFSNKHTKYLIFNDADTLLGMNYLSKWCSFCNEKESFVTNRIQETRASKSRRIRNIVNYGNLVVTKNDFVYVQGFDEGSDFYGGDDDDLFHRLKLLGLREINPYSYKETSQYSIVHSDELRLKNFKKNKRQDEEKAFLKIYENKNFINPNNDHLNGKTQTSVEVKIRYEMS